MDLPTRYRADPDVAPVLDRQPDLPREGGERIPARAGSLAGASPFLSRLGRLPVWLLAGAAAALAATIALALALGAGVVGVGAAGAVVRVAVALLALYIVCGYALTEFIGPGELRPYRALLVLPVGAAASALSLAVLGLLHVPLQASLAIVGVAGAAGAVLVRRRRPVASEPADPDESPAVRSRLVRLGLPLLVAAL